MRVATFDILHGRTVGDGVKVQRLRDCMRRLDPDVWPPSPAPPGRRGWLPRVTSNPGTAAYGIALLSRYPVAVASWA